MKWKLMCRQLERGPWTVDNMVSTSCPVLGTKSEACEEKEARRTVLTQELVRDLEAGTLPENVVIEKKK